MRAAGDAVAAAPRSGGFARAAGGVWHWRHGSVCVCVFDDALKLFGRVQLKSLLLGRVRLVCDC